MNTATPSPQFRNINAFKDLPTYRLPPGGWVSILHRASGVFLFLLLPWLVWLFGASVLSELSFWRFKVLFSEGFGYLPGGFWLGLAWLLLAAYTHHVLAGLRHLWMDMCHSAADKKTATRSAKAVLVLSVGLSLVFGLKLLGVY